MPFKAQTTVGLIARLASESPARVAFSCGASQVTCSQLWEQISELARAMTRVGVRRGERVAICAGNSIEWSLWEYASQAIAAVPVGIGTLCADDHRNDVLSHCDATVLVVQAAASLSTIAPERLRRCRLICVIDPVDSDARPALPWIAHAELVRGGDRTAFDLGCSPGDPATIIYTSGSTGKPKGVMHTQARTMAAVDAIVEFFPELEGGRIALGWMPMEHLFQRNLNLVSLAFGLETRVLRSAANLIDVIRDVRPTYMAGVPFVYEQLLHAIEASPESFAEWQREVRLMIIGSAPTLPTTLERFMELGFPIRQAYSTSECIVPIAANTLPANRVGSVGRPHASYALRISPEGEIRVRGVGVFNGYVGEAEGATDLFDEDGYFRTGDLGHLDSDGYLFVSGRAEDFFKSSTGRRISPLEVENAYKRSDLIEHIVVVGHARKHLVAIVQLQAQLATALAAKLGLASESADRWHEDASMKAAVLEEMRKHEAQLEPYKRVRDIVLISRPLSVEGGELTPNLKLRRQVIIQRYLPPLNPLHEGDPEADDKHAA